MSKSSETPGKQDESLSPNLYSQEYQENPAPVLAQLRSQDPVHRSQHGYWFLTRYDDVKNALKDSRFSSDWAKRRGGGPLHSPFTETDLDRANRELILSSFNMRDGEEHQRVRGLVNLAFSKASLESRRPRLEALATRLLPEPGKQFDLVKDFGFPLPIQISCEMIGIPAESREQFRASFEDAAVLGMPGHNEAQHKSALRALAWQVGYMRELLNEKRTQPGDDLLTALVEAEEAGQQLTPEEAIAAIVTIFTAAGTTTERFVSSGLLLLLQHPDDFERLRSDRSLMPTTIDEILRFHHPDQSTSTPRWVTEDLELRGKTLTRGDTVRFGLGAANRDPEQFPNPEHFDIARTPNRHLSFGKGAHFCLGATLARLVGEVAFSAVMDRYANLTLLTENPRRDPKRMDRYEEILVAG
ncbi:MAG: cytochrome P450 [Myxococcota bacterium]|jgi:cytochrome P450